MSTQNMKFDKAICFIALAFWLHATPGRAQPPAEAGYPTTGPISGYMDFHYNNDEGGDPRLDFHRFVLIFNHSFSSRIRFVGELELEHALVEGGEATGGGGVEPASRH